MNQYCVMRILALLAFLPHAWSLPAQGQVAMHEGYATAVDGARLFYRVVGAGSDTIVVVHGGPGFTMDYFLHDLEPLATRHTVVFYDQRGTGRSTLVSDSSALTGERFADDLEAIRRHFKLNKVNVLGHSWGVGVAALYALKYPDHVSRFILVGSIPLRRSSLADAFEKLNASRDSVSRRRMAELRQARLADPGDAKACHAYYAIWFEPFFGNRSAVSRSRGDFCAGTPEARRNKIRSVDRYVFASLGDWDWSSSLRSFTPPTLVIHGTLDPLPVAGAREWAALLPNARILELEGIGHFPYLESPDSFFSAVDAFLSSAWPVGSRQLRAH